ncbi:unnamed protein product [Calicophoron daubneyi]|uniref:Endoplasmic reticulum-Golgi intermediate compartment protein 3 n=1 Tax=Calicophoron daubneyi TaxID=300641 RepID=A0AAV2TUF9_CALDB
MLGPEGFFCRFDAFAKPLKDFRIKTVSGAIVSIISSVVIFFLFVSELVTYLSPQTKQEIIVDVNRGQKMSIKLDVTYFYIPCVMVNLDTMDTTGEQKIDVMHEVYKTPVDTNGATIADSVRHAVNDPVKPDISDRKDPNYCGSCYGAETSTRKCCNTCKEVQLAYHELHWVVQNVSIFKQCREENWEEEIKKVGKEGCRVHGILEVNRVAGSFHIAPGNSYASDHVHVHNLQAFSGVKMNMTHKITTLAFGDTYPGQVNPLDGVTMVVVEPARMFSYYLKLVPTIYTHYDSKADSDTVVQTNQYSVTWHSRGTPLSGESQGIPGLFFSYEISPILVNIVQENRSFLHFLTNTCAIVGGVFTVASLLDAFIYHSTCAVLKSSRRA